jgi:hypothetical protein
MSGIWESPADFGMVFPKSGNSLAKMGAQPGLCPGCAPIFAIFRDFENALAITLNFLDRILKPVVYSAGRPTTDNL